MQQQISDLNTIIALKKESIEKDSVESSFIEKNKDLYNQSISVLESMVKAKQDTINDNNKENENANKNLKYFKDARSSLEYMKSAWDSVRNAGRQAMGSIVSILETMGEDTDSTSKHSRNYWGFSYTGSNVSIAIRTLYRSGKRDGCCHECCIRTNWMGTNCITSCSHHSFIYIRQP